MNRVLRRSLVFATDALEPLPGLARAAEDAGFHRVWTTEYPGRDAVARALAVALDTRTIGVGTGIAYAFARPPLAMAGLAADVQRLSGGRFALGLGAGTRGVRRWYGTEFDPPAPRMASYVAELAMTWAGWDDRLAGTGPPAIYAAALHPVMVRTAARACGGVLLHPLARLRRHHEARVLPALSLGVADRGGPVEVAAWCITSIDEDPERARQRARAQIAFYFSTPSYGPVAAGTPWEAAATALRDAFAEGREVPFSKLGNLVPDGLVDELALAGTPADVAARASALETELAEGGVTELVFQTVGADMDESEVVANCLHIIATLGPGPAPRRVGATAATPGGMR